MKIILKEDIVNLGFKNDVVEVKNGYGRNYLIPQGKAILATPSALKIHAENLRQQAHKLAKVKADAEEAAKAFEGVALTIPVKVSPTGTIYGSVGANQIHEALLAAGHNVDRKIVSVHETVKTPGKYTAIVRLHKEVAVEIPFEVIAENAEELAAERAARKAEEAAHQAALAAAKAAEEGAEEAPEEGEAPAEEAPAAE
ncbi:MAG: 50S ribosomal protein L9 [Muribaculaceae bacterium]|jgi:large subunit ribosomal protein L9|nr:50S ribosomal protein L9 [Bacteroidales bacterium]MBQ1486859.1 50S ribosomal protein L9 [Muribaculaceae bacterium]MBQ1584399.1 50S ribosomal protein L9 [Muribaculaceae bacterium]MBQ1746705.1 50S ribosomal protein L9 [Muribaculaceae bacterium]MBR0493753.1 50S ribosomal protein L9 [Muribaculaceae bacterium]